MSATGEARPVSAQTETLQWDRVLREALARQQGPGESLPEAVRTLTGLERLRGVLEGRFPRPPITDALGFFPVEVAKGSAAFHGVARPEHSNGMGTVHGGWIATLLDSCMGWAVYTTLDAGQGFTTLELKLNFVRALAFDGTVVRAEGTILNAGRTIVTADGRLYGSDAKLRAHATATCLVLAG